MEQREKLKDSVKQKVVEFMAEQIAKEESFLDLKSELIEELFIKKEVKTIEIKSDTPVNLSAFELIATKAEDSLQKIKDNQFNSYKKLIDIKLGRNTSEKTIKLLRQLQDKDLTSYADIIEELEGKKIPAYNDFIIDPKLKFDFTEVQKQKARKSSLGIMKEIMENPFSDTLNSTVRAHSNEDNYYKEYNVNDKSKNFSFECSYVYNNATKQKYIDKLSVDSKGFLLNGEELGIQFGISAMELIDQAEVVRQKVIESLEKKPKNPLPNKTIENVSPTRNKKTAVNKSVVKKK